MYKNSVFGDKFSPKFCNFQVLLLENLIAGVGMGDTYVFVLHLGLMFICVHTCVRVCVKCNSGCVGIPSHVQSIWRWN